MKKTLGSTVLAIIVSIGLFAQGGSPSQLSINYNIGVPSGEFSDYISPASLRGMNFQYDYFLNDRFALGASIGWNGFYEKKERESYIFEQEGATGAINGTRFNYFYSLPILMKAQYRIVDAGQVLPYAAFGMGPYFTEQETYIGSFGFKERNWTFGVVPELGLLANLGQSGWAFKVAASYHVNFYNKNNINSLQYLGFNFGFNYDF